MGWLATAARDDSSTEMLPVRRKQPGGGAEHHERQLLVAAAPPALRGRQGSRAAHTCGAGEPPHYHRGHHGPPLVPAQPPGGVTGVISHCLQCTLISYSGIRTGNATL